MNTLHTTISFEDGIQLIDKFITQIQKVVKGKRKEIELVLTCLLSQGHVLIEDNPGTGKTILARTLANTIASNPSSDAVFKRIQFTPDLLPMDLIGSYVYDESNKDFLFKKGPIFTNILLADEVNRASPKVQSALLECLAEGQVSAGDTTFKLDDLFFTIATQNPIEMEGTYPLPAAQLDRFAMKIHFGYADSESELAILMNYQEIHNNLKSNPTEAISKDQILALQSIANNVYIHEALVRCIHNIITQSRIHENITLGASTRAGISLIKCLKAYAFIQGRNYVIENDVALLLQPSLMHRMLFKNKLQASNNLREILESEFKKLNHIDLNS